MKAGQIHFVVVKMKTAQIWHSSCYNVSFLKNVASELIGFEHRLLPFSTLLQHVPLSQRLSIKRKKHKICRISLLGECRSLYSMFLLENSEK